MKIVVVPAMPVYNLHTAVTNTYFANGIAVHNKLGAEFVDLSNSKGLKRIEWSSYAPDWRIARLRLCLEGTCTNKDCQAHADEVVINIGSKRFDYLTDVDNFKCPMCGNYVEAKTCAFNNCRWCWWGIKQAQCERRDQRKFLEIGKMLIMLIIDLIQMLVAQ